MSQASCVRITYPNGTTLLIPEPSIYHIETSAVLETHSIGKRISAVHYRLDRNTDVNATSIAIFNGANDLYEYGWYENSGVFICCLSNRT